MGKQSRQSSSDARVGTVGAESCNDAPVIVRGTTFEVV